MAGSQGKSDRAVIELGVQPVVGSVATFTRARKARRDVVGTPSRAEIGGMAGRTSRGHGLKLAGGCALVAGIAVHDRVRSGQRKAVIMLLNLPD